LSLIIAILLAAFYLDPPWGVVVVLLAAAWEGLEIAIFLRWRKRRPLMGPETLIGARGIAVTGCRPDGQARVAGRFWTVTCATGAEPGEPVIVEGVDGTRLRVRRAEGDASGPPGGDFRGRKRPHRGQNPS
jgi:membrane protein implicated in regulation of membrane protease activity